MKKIIPYAKAEDDIAQSKIHSDKCLCPKTVGPVKKPLSGQKVIHIKERNFRMLKKDLILKNPLMSIGDNGEDILPPV